MNMAATELRSETASRIAKIARLVVLNMETSWKGKLALLRRARIRPSGALGAERNRPGEERAGGQGHMAPAAPQPGCTIIVATA
ncbi:hypothetical protein MASR1M49_29450 [Pararhodobacter aggregans]